MNQTHNLERFQPVLELMGELTTEQSRIALAIYRAIAERGTVTPYELASITGKTEGENEDYMNETAGIYRDENGSIVGFWGLTAAPISDHQIVFESKTRYAWWAWDTLFIPELLDATLKITSKCAETQKPISLEVSPEEIVSASSPAIIVSMLVPDESAFTKDIIGSFCHHIHFFETADAGQRWIADKSGIELLSLQEAFELGQLKNNYQFYSELPPNC